VLEVDVGLFRVGGCFHPEALAPVRDQQWRDHSQEAGHNIEHSGLNTENLNSKNIHVLMLITMFMIFTI